MTTKHWDFAEPTPQGYTCHVAYLQEQQAIESRKDCERAGKTAVVRYMEVLYSDGTRGNIWAVLVEEEL